MTKPAEYNSVENYKRLFMDIIAEVGDESTGDETIYNIFAGFEAAIIDWMSYHDDATKRLRKLHACFMRGEAESLLD